MSGTSYTERPAEESPLLWPLLALLVIGVACFTYYWDGHRYQFPYSTKHDPPSWPPPPEAASTETSAAAEALAPSSGAPVVAALGNFTALALPGGVSLNIPELGIESKLNAFITDSSRPVDKTTWFDFDRLLFDTGKATLRPASKEQLQNIADILKAYPKVHARIGGYTDSTGNPEANLQLSDERASNVMREIVKLGVGVNRLDAKGYGSAHPVADNATAEGRAQNRRISMRVLEK